MGSHSWKIPPLCEVLFASGNWGLITEVPTPSPPTSVPHPTAAAERGRPTGKTAALTWVPRSVVPFTLQVELRWLTAVVLTCLVKGNNQVYFLTFYLLILERKERRERNKHQFVPLIYSFIGSFLYVPQLGNQTYNLGILGWCSNQLSYLAKIHLYNAILNVYYVESLKIQAKFT